MCRGPWCGSGEGVGGKTRLVDDEFILTYVTYTPMHTATMSLENTLSHQSTCLTYPHPPLPPHRGTLGPDEYTLMTVTYTPKHTGTFSSENFSISTAGGNKVTLNLRGTALGPKVVLSATSFNFGNVPAGQTPSRVLYLQNQSDVSFVDGEGQGGSYRRVRL